MMSFLTTSSFYISVALHFFGTLSCRQNARQRITSSVRNKAPARYNREAISMQEIPIFRYEIYDSSRLVLTFSWQKPSIRNVFLWFSSAPRLCFVA